MGFDDFGNEVSYNQSVWVSVEEMRANRRYKADWVKNTTGETIELTNGDIVKPGFKIDRKAYLKLAEELEFAVKSIKEFEK